MTHSANAYAARIENGIVREVISIPYSNDEDTEITAYCNGIGLDGSWLDTSWLGARRGKFAGVGDLYDADANFFVTPEPQSPIPD